MNTTPAQTTIPEPANARASWMVEPRKVLASLKAGTVKSAKDLSWLLLSDEHVFETMQDEEHGEDAESNLALSTFEDALDWRLGALVLSCIRATVKATKRLPKPFRLVVGPKGTVYILTVAGRRIEG